MRAWLLILSFHKGESTLSLLNMPTSKITLVPPRLPLPHLVSECDEKGGFFILQDQELALYAVGQEQLRRKVLQLLRPLSDRVRWRLSRFRQRP